MKEALILFFCISVFHVSAQRTISGTVYGGKDYSYLIGANIRVKGTTLGTSTDIDGKFSLNFPKDKTILEVSCVGMKTQEVQLSASNQVDVTLHSDDVLPEFVVTAQSAICHGKSINTCGDPYRYIQGLSAEFIEHKEIPTLSLSILGNPFKDFFVLNINSEKEEKGLVSLYNIEGKILKTIPINLVKGDNRLEINDVSNLLVGSYTVTVNILNKEQPTVVVRDSFLQITQSVFELMKKEKPEQDINRKQNIIPLNKEYYELLLMSNAFMTKAAHVAKMYKQDVPESTYLWELRQHKDSEEIQPYMAEIEDLVKDYRKIEEKQKLMDNKKEIDDIDKTFVLEVLYHSNADQYYLYLIKKEVITSKKVYSQVIVKM